MGHPGLSMRLLSQSPRGTAFVCLTAILLLFGFLRARIAEIPLERDEGAYAYIGQRWLEGEIPYRDTLENKPPGIFAFNALVQSLFPGSIAALHWGGHAWLSLTLLCIYWAGRSLFSHTAGLAAMLAAGLIILDPRLLGNAANTELFMIGPLAAGFAWVAREGFGGRRRRVDALIVGVFAALALLFKQVALLDAGLLVLFALVQSRRGADTSLAINARPLADLVKQLLAVSLGALALLIPVFLYFRSHDALDELYYCLVESNISYGTRIPLEAYAVNFWLTLKPKLPALWPLLAFMVWGLLRSDREGYSRWGWVGAWLVTAAAGMSLGGYFREHYYVQIAPPAALFAGQGMSLAALACRRFCHPAWILGGLLFLCTANNLIVNRWYYFGSSPEAVCRGLYGGNPFPESVPAGQWIARKTPPEATVYIFGSEAQILYYAHRRHASRFIAAYHLTGGRPDSEQRQEETLQEIYARRPAAVVIVLVPVSFMKWPPTPPTMAAPLQSWLREHYQVSAWSRLDSSGRTEWKEDRETCAEWEGRSIWYHRQEGQATLVIWTRRS